MTTSKTVYVNNILTMATIQHKLFSKKYSIIFKGYDFMHTCEADSAFEALQLGVNALREALNF